MNERARTVLRGVLATGGFLFVTLIFFALTFPYGTLKDRIVGQFNAGQKNTSARQELQIEELAGWRVSGVRATGVRLLTANGGKPPGVIYIDEARARLQLLPLLIFNKDIRFELDVLGGTVEGSFGDHGSERVVELTFDGVDAGGLDPLKQAVCNVPLKGNVFGTIAFRFPQGKASKGDGTVNLEIRNMSIGDGKTKPDCNAFIPALPKLAIGTLVVEGEAKEGRLVIKKLSASGQDLTLDGGGSIAMKELAPESLVDLSLTLKVSDGWIQKDSLTKGLLDPKIGAVWLDPKVKKAKNADGSLSFRAAGPLGKLNFNPAGGTPPAKTE